MRRRVVRSVTLCVWLIRGFCGVRWARVRFAPCGVRPSVRFQREAVGSSVGMEAFFGCARVSRVEMKSDGLMGISRVRHCVESELSVTSSVISPPANLGGA